MMSPNPYPGRLQAPVERDLASQGSGKASTATIYSSHITSHIMVVRNLHVYQREASATGAGEEYLELKLV
jgi:hypothetical protein